MGLLKNVAALFAPGLVYQTKPLILHKVPYHDSSHPHTLIKGSSKQMDSEMGISDFISKQKEKGYFVDEGIQRLVDDEGNFHYFFLISKQKQQEGVEYVPHVRYSRYFAKGDD